MPVELGTTNITAPPSQGGFNFNIRSNLDGPVGFMPLATRIDWLEQQNIKDFTRTYKSKIDNQHAINMQNIDSHIDKIVKDEGGSNEPMDTTTPEEMVKKEHVIHVKLYYNSKAEETKHIEKAKSLNVDTNIKPFYHPLDLFPRYEYRNAEVRKQGLINWASGYEAVRLSQVYAETARRLKAKADALAIIEAEQARIAAEAEAKRIADEAAALKAANTYRLPAAGASQLSTAAGSIAITAGSGLTLDAAIQAAKAALGTVVSAATAVGIGALVYSPSLGNGELPATMLNTPAKDLAPNLPENLAELAAAGGTVDVPYRIYGDQSKYSVVATQPTGGLAATVPVRALVLDPVANAYTFTTTDTPPITLTFPIAVPGNSSTATPAQPVETPVYTGITLTPIEVKAEPLPAASQLNIRDGIYVYPSDSGLPPIYAVFSSPYEGATTKGEHSGRMYNPDKAGGPTQNLDWTTASVTQEGIDLVKLHTGRFDPSDANKIMIDRLEKILSGQATIEDVDKRFYTHEIRELERYRTLGVLDGVMPSDDGATWNNTHAATLEDFKLKDGADLFYTPEAIEADRLQSEREAK